MEKILGTPIITKSLMSRISLEDTLTRFFEQCSHYEPSTLRKKLKKQLGSLKVNLNSSLNADKI